MSSRLHPTPLLRRALGVDAAMGVPSTVLGLVAPATMAQWLGLPAMLLAGTSVLLVGFTAVLIMLFRSQTMSTVLVRGVIAFNAAWVLASVALAASGLLQPTVWGAAFLGLNALLPGVLGILEWKGLRASSVTGQPLARA